MKTQINFDKHDLYAMLDLINKGNVDIITVTSDTEDDTITAHIETSLCGFTGNFSIEISKSGQGFGQDW